MKIQVAKILFAGTWIVEYDDKANANPYRIYYKYYHDGWRRKLKEKYADFQSCMFFLLQEFTGHEWRMI